MNSYDEQDGGGESGAPADAVVDHHERGCARSGDDPACRRGLLRLSDRVQGEPTGRRSGRNGHPGIVGNVAGHVGRSYPGEGGRHPAEDAPRYRRRTGNLGVQPEAFGDRLRH